MSIRATSIGVTSFDLPAERENPFWTWAFTRNPSHCARLAGAVDGCTLVTDAEVQLLRARTDYQNALAELMALQGKL